jgi:hypothetical protein
MEADYTAFLQNLQRPINCLTDQDRNIRRQGLETLRREVSKASKEHQGRLFTTSHLAKNLVHTLADPIENNRELTLAIWQGVVEGGVELPRECS